MLDLLLSKTTKEFPSRKKSWVKNILVLSLCMLQKETVCLNKLKGEVGQVLGRPEVDQDSHYKRLNRIFQEYSLSSFWIELLQYSFKLLRLKSRHLILDGTSWEKGGRKLHYLTLGVTYKGVAIPIYWHNLRKKGNSSEQERIKLLKRAQKYFLLEGKTLLADREYIGATWFKYLSSSKIDFVIRLRKKTYRHLVDKAPGKSYHQMARQVLKSKKYGKAIGKTVTIEGQAFHFVMMKNPKPTAEEPVIYLLSSLGSAPGQVARQYSARWQIETCFKHLKSNGFDLEKMNVAGTARQNLMLAVVVFAYTLSVCEGLKEYKDVPMKKHPDGRTNKACSVFRYGINILCSLCGDLEKFCMYILENLHTGLPRYRSPNSLFV